MPMLDDEMIQAAIDGLEAKQQQIAHQLSELRNALKGGSTTKPARKGRKLAPETIERMREAQQLRWAKARGETPTKALPKPKAKRKLSAEGRKAISEATKKRWAAKRAQNS